jgi:hypothetical protein
VAKDQLFKSLKDSVGEEPPPDAVKQYDDYMAKFKAAGCTSMSVVVNMKKDAKNPAEGVMLVVGMDEGADSAKAAEFVKTSIPDLAKDMHADCPKEIEGCLVWYEKSFTLPPASPERLEAFEYALSQVPDDQSISIMFVPDENVAAAATAGLKKEEAELATALLGGSGICLFTNFGIAADPGVKLLVLTPDAGGADKLQKVAEAFIGEMKKSVPPPFTAALDSLKAVAAGSNVQLSLGLADWSKVLKEMMQK